MTEELMQKVKLLNTAILASALLWAAASEAADSASDGSNQNGSERVCGKPGKNLTEAFGECRRGDIAGLALVGSGGAAAICDFTKAIVYSRGEPIACVFSGQIRLTPK